MQVEQTRTIAAVERSRGERGERPGGLNVQLRGMSYASGRELLQPKLALRATGPARDPLLRAAQCQEGVRRALTRPVLKRIPAAVNDALLLNKVGTWEELEAALAEALGSVYPQDQVGAKAAHGVGQVRTVGVEMRRIAATELAENAVESPAAVELEGLDINRFTTVESAIAHVRQVYAAKHRATGQTSLFGPEEAFAEVEKRLRTSTLLRELQDLRGVALLVEAGIIPSSHAAELAGLLVSGAMRHWPQLAGFIGRIHGRALTGEELKRFIMVNITVATDIAAKRFFDRQAGAGMGRSPLVVGSNTKEDGLLSGVDRELSGIAEAVPEAALAANVTSIELGALLSQRRSSMLWYMGHANEKGLRLNDATVTPGEGAITHNPTEAIAGAGLDLVALNACNTLPLAEGIAQAGTNAVGTVNAINDERAAMFGETMMGGLGMGQAGDTAMQLAGRELHRTYGGHSALQIKRPGQKMQHQSPKIMPYGMYVGDVPALDAEMGVGLKKKRGQQERAKREKKLKLPTSASTRAPQTLQQALASGSLAAIIRVCGIASDFASEHAAAVLAAKPKTMAHAQRLLLSRYVTSLVGEARYDGPVAARFGLLSRDDHARFLVHLRQRGVQAAQVAGPLELQRHVKAFRAASPTLLG